MRPVPLHKPQILYHIDLQKASFFLKKTRKTKHKRPFRLNIGLFHPHKPACKLQISHIGTYCISTYVDPSVKAVHGKILIEIKSIFYDPQLLQPYRNHL